MIQPPGAVPKMEQFSKRALVFTAAAVVMFAACGTATDSIGTRAPATTASTRASTTEPSTAAPTTAPTISSTTEPSTAAPTTAPAVEAPATVEAPAVEAHATPETTIVSPATEAPTTLAPVTYTVIKVVDGDTVDVAASDGNSFTVRLIGIDTPETGACEAQLATDTMTTLVDGKAVELALGGDGEDVDKYGRALRYVDAEGVDAGLTMIELGLARSRYDSRDGYGRHDREDGYIAADQASANYTCPAPSTTTATTVARAPKPTTPKPIDPKPTTSSRSRCDPNYSGCVPIDSDVDCAGGKGNGPSYVAGPVRVIGSDIYDLDRDGDGVACE